MELYYVPFSNFCRQVRLVGSAVGIEFDLKRIRMDKGEHLTPEFVKVIDKNNNLQQSELKCSVCRSILNTQYQL